MTRDFGFYEYAGIIIPGAVLILGVLWLWPEVGGLAERQGVSLGELGILVILAYAAGQLIQGVGKGIEWVMWRLAGGMPSRQILCGKLLSAQQHMRLHEVLNRTDACPDGPSSLPTAEWLAIVREVYSVVSAAGKAGRVDSFSGTYSLLRGLAAALLVLLVAAALLGKGMPTVGALAVLFGLALQRMHRFGRYFALELFVQYLLVTRPSNAAPPAVA